MKKTPGVLEVMGSTPVGGLRFLTLSHGHVT